MNKPKKLPCRKKNGKQVSFDFKLSVIDEINNGRISVNYAAKAGRDQSSNKEKMKVEIESLFASNTFNVENWQSQEVIVRDDIAIHRYSGVVIIKSKTDTTKLEVSLKYLDVLKKDKNGDWKVYIHSNSPNE